MWLSVDGLSKYLSISKETVYRLVYARKIPFNRIGKLYRFHTRDVDRWVRRKK